MLSKKLVLVGLLLFGSVNLMAKSDYVVGVQSCEHKTKTGTTYFIVRGKGDELSSTGSNLAMGTFLDAEYAVETSKHCKLGAIIHANGVVFHYKSKAKANRKFSELINDYKGLEHTDKLIIIRGGYNEKNWR